MKGLRITQQYYLFAAMLLPIACGSEIDCDNGVEMSALQAAEFQEVEDCAKISKDPFLVVWAPAIDCPQPEPFNQRCCLADEPFRPCADRPGKLCGRLGRYNKTCKTVVLPEGCNVAFRHEAIHYLLDESGRDSSNHQSPEFACEYSSHMLGE